MRTSCMYACYDYECYDIKKDHDDTQDETPSCCCCCFRVKCFLSERVHSKLFPKIIECLFWKFETSSEKQSITYK